MDQPGLLNGGEPARRVAPDRPEPAPARPKPSGPLSATETRLQGEWQAYDFAGELKTWKMQFDERGFYAQSGVDDWYRGTIVVRPDEEPPWFDFEIEDCSCSYKGMASTGIYFWDGESVLISAPRPGNPRPPAFNSQSGNMMRLMRMPRE